MPVPDRVILHIDMDAFFAQVETLADPRLLGKALVIGGRPGERAVVATASYEARRFGIRSGMPLVQARRLCPDAVFLPCHPNRYVAFSARILRLLLDRTPLVEMASIDEAFLDATSLARSLDSGRDLASSIQLEIRERIRLGCSIGVGPNKLIAKMASGVRKPGGLTVMAISDFRSRFQTEPVSALYGVGEATSTRLRSLGIARIGDLASASPYRLREIFGVWGPALVNAARGEESSPVQAHHTNPLAKSLGHEYTLAKDEASRDRLRRLLLGLCDEVAGDLRAEDRQGRTVHLKVRWSDYSMTMRQMALSKPTASTRTIFRTAWRLLAGLDPCRPIRLIGVGMSRLCSHATVGTVDLFDDGRLDHLDRVVDRIHERYGRNTLRRACMLPEGER